jgi:HD-GYP domain-containing protein (c-di-GMP phosphodiesterase class II)
MDSPRIVITAPGPSPRSWNSTSQLRIGRLPDLEIILDDESVSRQHAEVVLTDEGWIIRDLGSSNGTHLNDVRIGRPGRRIRKGDILRIGRIALRVEHLRDRPAVRIKASGQTVRIESATARSWDEAVGSLVPAGEAWDRHGQALLRLMRDGYRLSQAPSLDDGLQAVLDQAVEVFDAQRGGIFLPDGLTGELNLRCVSTRNQSSAAGRGPSKTLAGRAFRGGRSLLFTDCQKDAELRSTESVAQGTMSAIICAVLRSPDASLGILHLDRGPLDAPFTEPDLYLADSLAAALALGVERRYLVEKQQEQLLQTVTALAQAVEMRDRYTGNHTFRVTTYALVLADELALPATDRRLLQIATPLHDLGKIAIDDGVLRKPGRLTAEEFDHMKSHVLSGVEIVQMIPGLGWVLPVVRSHHERWDGTGYPDGLKGETIPLSARVVAVADAFDAMTSDRPYRRGMPAAEAFAELQANAGTHFDPTCVDAFLRARVRIETLLGEQAFLLRQAEDVSKTISKKELDIMKKELGQQTGRETAGPG